MSDSFTNQKPRIATEEECRAPWSGHKDGRNFRCKLCGHRFQVGDQWRWLYGKVITNFMVCAECDNGNDDDLRAKMEAAVEESKQKFWWLWVRLDDAEHESSRPIYTSCPRCKEEFRA